MGNLISAKGSTSSGQQIRAAFLQKTPYCHLFLPRSIFETRKIIIVSTTSLTTSDKWIVDLARQVRKKGLQLLTWYLLIKRIGRKTPLQRGDHWGWWLAMVCSSEKKPRRWHWCFSPHFLRGTGCSEVFSEEQLMLQVQLIHHGLCSVPEEL